MLDFIHIFLRKGVIPLHAIKPAVQTATFEPGDLVLSRKLFGADLYLVVGTEKEIWALPCHAHKISESVIGSNAGKTILSCKGKKMVFPDGIWAETDRLQRIRPGRLNSYCGQVSVQMLRQAQFAAARKNQRLPFELAFMRGTLIRSDSTLYLVHQNNGTHLMAWPCRKSAAAKKAVFLFENERYCLTDRLCRIEGNPERLCILDMETVSQIETEMHALIRLWSSVSELIPEENEESRKLFDSLDTGDIVYAWKPFNDATLEQIGEDHCRRPYLVIEKGPNDLVAFPASHQSHGSSLTTLALSHREYPVHMRNGERLWAQYDSFYDLRQAASLPVRNLICRSGHLRPEHLNLLKKKLIRYNPEAYAAFRQETFPEKGDIFQQDGKLFWVRSNSGLSIELTETQMNSAPLSLNKKKLYPDFSQPALEHLSPEAEFMTRLEGPIERSWIESLQRHEDKIAKKTSKKKKPKYEFAIGTILSDGSGEWVYMLSEQDHYWVCGVEDLNSSTPKLQKMAKDTLQPLDEAVSFEDLDFLVFNLKEQRVGAWYPVLQRTISRIAYERELESDDDPSACMNEILQSYW